MNDNRTCIKKYRIAAGYSQEELSHLTGIPLGTLRRWEQSGGNIRNAQRLVPIADILNCTTDELLGRDIPKKQINLDREELQLISLFRKLNQTGQALALERIRGMVDMAYVESENKELF